MTDGNNRKKAQAVFFSLVMVLSMVGGSVALAGSAAAAAPDGGSLSDTYVQSDATVTIEGINANADGNSLEVIALNQSGDQVGSSPISDSDVSDTESWSTEFAVSDLGLSDGDFDIYINDTEDGVDSSVGTLTVDDAEPTVTPTSPVDGDVINSQTETINLDISDVDGDTANGDLSISVDIDNNGNINTYKINPGSDTADGVNYDTSTGELTISPGTEVPELQEGTVNVEVSATDRADNTNTSSYAFEVDQNGPTSQFNSPALTNDENETISVSLSPSADRQIDDSTVSLDINGQTSASFDYEDDEYDNSSNEFTIVPGSSDVPSLADDEYSVDVSATDDAGNTHTETYNFEVDLSQITANDVVLSESVLNSQSDDPTLTVTFGEDVDASEVSADVNIDGTTQETLTFTATENSDEAEAVLDLDSYGAVENDSAIVNVTSAQDVAGNGLINPDGADSQTSFVIDTDGPSVSLNEPTQDLSGYVNVSSFIASTDDVNGQSVQVWVGGESAAAVDITSEADDLDTRDLPDGTHTLGVIVTDDAGNEDVALVPVTLNNGDDVTVQSGFLAGTYNHVSSDQTVTKPSGNYEVPVDGQFNLSTDVFDYSGDESDVTYYVSGVDQAVDQGTDEVTGDDLVFDANDYDDGDIVTLEASAGGETATVDIQVDRLEINNVATDESENPSEITVESNRADLDELNVTVQDNDEYVAPESVALTRDDFTVSGDGPYTYTANVPELRDGNFNVTVDDAADGAQTVTPDLTSADFTVDNTEPSVVNAAVVDGDSSGLTVQVLFDEPVNSLNTDAVSVEGTSASVDSSEWYLETTESGAAFLTFDEEFQTADKPNVTVDATGVDDAFGTSNSDNSETTETGIYTSIQGLEAGINVMSIPAETGSVAIDDVEINGDIETIWAYEDGDWQMHNVSESSDVNDFSALEGGQGYVVNATEDTTIALNAENVPSESQQAPQSQQIDEGWNLIGHYQEGSQSVGQALAYLDGTGATYDVERGYSGTQVTQLDPGQGYWVFSNAESVHAPVNYGGTVSERPVVGNVQMTDDDGELTQGEEVDISAEVDHDAIVEQVNANVEGELGIGNVELTDGDDDGVYDATATVDFTADATPGATYEIFVDATDVDGNTGFASGSAVAVDSTAPSVSGVSVSDSSGDSIVTDGEDVTVSATVTDASLDTVTADASDFGAGTVTLTQDGDTDTYSTTISSAETTVDSEGTATVSITATDAVNNVNDTKSAQIELDGVAPSISEESPTGTSVSTDTAYTATLSDSGSGIDEGSIVVSVSDGDSTTDNSLSGVGTGNDAVTFNADTGELTVDTTPYDSGETITVTVDVDDNAGNSAETSTTEFTVA